MLSAAKHLVADRDRPFAECTLNGANVLRVTRSDCSNGQGLCFIIEPCLEDSIHLQNLPQIFLDFLEITVYTSNNLKTKDNRSTLWKRYVILMSLRHWIQTQAMLKRRKRRLLHPIDGPGAVHSKILSSSSHF